ncbi:MAG: serine hydrolase domain-containing protein [Bacteroidota bacterium]
MRGSLLILAVIVLACNSNTKQTAPTINNAKLASVQKYSLPVFTDSASFTNVSKFYPIIDTVFKRYAKRNSFPSIAYGLVIGDSLVYSGATGLANVKDKRAATTKTLYRIASMSKSFTAMAILKLRDEGKLSLTDPVSKYIPEINGGGALTTDAQPITIQNLLTMSAGFPEDNPWGDRQLADKDQELIDQIKNGIAFSNVPGVTFEYSNMGFAMLGIIIKKVSGNPYQSYINQNVIDVVGMKNTKWEYSEISPELFAQGYRWEDKTWKEEPVLHDGTYGAMGGMICSIEDFAKYISLHLSAWPPRNTSDNGPVKRSSIREMHQPWRISGMTANAKTRTGVPCPTFGGYGYGLGWRQDCNGLVRVSHSGGLPGYGSEWRIYPEYNIGIVSFANHTYGAPGFPNGVVLDTLIQLAGLKKRELPASDILKQRRDEIVSLLPDFNDAESKKIFGENFWLDHTAASRQKSIKEVFGKAGKIVSVSDITPENQLRGSFTIKCEKQDVHVFFTLTPEREAYIQQLDIYL